MVTLDAYRAYARHDCTEDDIILQQLIAAAEQMISHSTGKQRPESGSQLYDIAVMQLAAHWDENRTPVEEAVQHEVPFHLQALIDHIATCSRFPDLEENAADGTDK